MKEDIINWFKELTFEQVLVFIVLLFILNLLYKLFSGFSTKYSKIADCKDMKFGELMSFVDSILTDWEDTIYVEGEEIIRESDLYCDSKTCGLNPKETQISAFSLVLERALFLIIRSKIKLFMKQNHFYEKTGEKLEAYVQMRSTEIKVLYKKTMNGKKSMYKYLDEKGFIESSISQEKCEKIFKKIVNKAKEIKLEEKKEIQKINDEYSLIKRVISFFNKYKKIAKTVTEE